MICYRTTFNKVLFTLLLVLSFAPNNNVFAADGEALFKANCANCHKPDADYTGPALKGWSKRIPSPDWIYKWVANPAQMIASDAYAKALFEKWKPTVMTSFSSLKKDEVDAILKYVDDYTPPAAAQTATTGGEGGETDNSMIFGILTLVLALVAFILLQVNSNLRKLSDDKVGIHRGEPVPFYRNKAYLMAGILLLFAVGGYYVISAAIGLGRMKNYQPVQPIYYSHKVHAGTNQISCLYCHGSAQDSKHAGIPSVNVCMNCHKAIKEYKGDPIVREDGSAL